MANSTVKWSKILKGFGSIEFDMGGKNVFVNISGAQRADLTCLADAQKVTFDVEAGPDGRESVTSIAIA